VDVRVVVGVRLTPSDLTSFGSNRSAADWMIKFSSLDMHNFQFMLSGLKI